MLKVFWGIVIYISKRIGSWKKTFKQKILLLILTCAVAYPVLMYLPEAKGARNNPLEAALLMAALVLLPATFFHLRTFPPNKETRLKFWKKQEPDNE